jgi:hypothetical protein
MKNKRWIQKAKLKKGTLSKQLGIPEKDNIPIALLEKVKKANVGTKVKGKTVTMLMKRRANLALNLKRMKK